MRNSITKIRLIIRREYLSRVRKRSFILTTFLTPIGMLLLIIVPALLTSIGQSDKHIAVLDQSGYFQNGFPDKKQIYFKIENQPLDSLKAQLKAGQIDALLYIPTFELNRPQGIKLYSEKPLGMLTQDYINTQVNLITEQARVNAAHIDRATYDQLKIDVPIESIVMEQDQERRSSSGLAFGIGYVSAFLIYTLLLVYGMMVMRGVMEEKTNRIIEVMISAVKPFELMLGKIIGIGAVGITQFILWGALIMLFQFFAGLFFVGHFSSMPATSMNGINMEDKMYEMQQVITAFQQTNLTGIVLAVVFYFLGGYLLYASIFAAIGAATGDDGDSQAATFPVTAPIIISIFIMMQAVNDPDGKLAFWGSMIPLSSPIVMPARIPFGVPWWQLVLSMLFLVLGFLLFAWMAAKVYRTGILMYGKKTSFKEMWKWIRQG